MNLEENEVSVKKTKDDYELLGITWGKYYQKSFVFHVKSWEQKFEIPVSATSTSRIQY